MAATSVVRDFSGVATAIASAGVPERALEEPVLRATCPQPPPAGSISLLFVQLAVAGSFFPWPDGAADLLVMVAATVIAWAQARQAQGGAWIMLCANPDVGVRPVAPPREGRCGQ